MELTEKIAKVIMDYNFDHEELTIESDASELAEIIELVVTEHRQASTLEYLNRQEATNWDEHGNRK